MQINIFGNLSTGRIAVDIYKTLVSNGHEGVIAFARGNIEDDIPYIKIGTSFDVKLHALLTRITDRTGFYSISATKKLINDIKQYNPDIIHLHNIHGYYVNIKILFNFLKEFGKPVIWTLHDCWAFTGHCAYFDYEKCDKWKKQCSNCPQKNTYPASKFLDASNWNYIQKKKLFSNISNLTIVTPSNWLANLVKQSFLNAYRVEVINNGIDLENFKPVLSSFRSVHKLENKFIILGVAGEWSERKGLRDFIRLSEILTEDYQIVLVGLNKKQSKKIPNSIIAIEKTNSVCELAEIYSTADIFLNTTYEENFPTVNLESIACGTPVVTYNTGGSPESLTQKSGSVIEQGDLIQFLNIVKSNYFQTEDCVNQAQKYDKSRCFQKYLSEYYKICDEGDEL